MSKYAPTRSMNLCFMVGLLACLALPTVGALSYFEINSSARQLERTNASHLVSVVTQAVIAAGKLDPQLLAGQLKALAGQGVVFIAVVDEQGKIIASAGSPTGVIGRRDPGSKKKKMKTSTVGTGLIRARQVLVPSLEKQREPADKCKGIICSIRHTLAGYDLVMDFTPVLSDTAHKRSLALFAGSAFAGLVLLGLCFSSWVRARRKPGDD